MNIIVCVDDNNGMLFNNRRQSRDRRLIRRVRNITEGHRLWMNAYSARLFGDGVCVAEDFLDRAEPDDFCFIENVSVPREGIEQVILYRWNREYPADVYFDLDLGGIEPNSIYEFKGSSHECITEEIYTLT